MSKSIIAKSITAAAVIGGLVAGLAVLFVPAVQQAMAETVVDQPAVVDNLHQAAVKGDRLPALASGAACSSRGWPHYEQTCQFDLRGPATVPG
jgi:hypothetical protein